MTHILYKLRNTITGDEYIGITGNFKRRMSAHRCSAKTGRTHLYRSISKYGWDCFSKEVLCCGSKDYIAQLEVLWIKRHNPPLNVSSGGEIGGCVAPFHHDEWIRKLKEKRAGRQPAKGMKHTDENKKQFSEFGKKRWDIYGRYPSHVIELSFKDARKTYGISKTHYYRLKNCDLV